MEILKQAIKRNLSVTAFVRSPIKIGSHLQDKVTIARGDVMDYFSVKKAVVGHDTVISALGTRTVEVRY